MGLAKDVVRPSMMPVSAVAAAKAAAFKAREDGAEFVKAAETAISNAAANVLPTPSEANAP